MSQLVCDINVYGLELKRIIFVYKNLNLEDIDAYTSIFKDKYDFFNKEKNKILELLTCNKEKYNLKFPPNYLELNTVFIISASNKYQPLFKTIKYQGEIKDLEMVIKEKIARGGIKKLLLCDLELQQELGSVSLFKDIDVIRTKKIMYDLLSEEDIEKILMVLKSYPYYYTLVRLLLADSSIKDILEQLSLLVTTRNSKENLEKIRMKKPEYWYLKN